MDEKDIAVKANDQGAATGDGVKTDNQDAPLDTVALLEKLRKAESDRDNYRAGLLALKGKKVDDEDFDIQKLIDLSVQEALATRNVTATEDELKKALKEREEAITALKNRSQITNNGQGASTEDKSKVTDGVLSEEKIARFKGMGWSDEKIETYKKNLMRNNGFVR